MWPETIASAMQSSFTPPPCVVRVGLVDQPAAVLDLPLVVPSPLQDVRDVSQRAVFRDHIALRADLAGVIDHVAIEGD